METSSQRTNRVSSQPRPVRMAARQRAGLIVILLASWALLIWQLDGRSLWVDEFLTLETVRQATPEVIAASVADIHPPLYFLALHGWISVAGPSDFSIRWLSVAAGLLAIAFMPALARRAGRPGAVLCASALLAFAPAFVEYSRMARYYSLLLMLSVLSTCTLYNAMNSGRRITWTVYGVANLALLYTFYPAGALIAAQFVAFILPARSIVLIRRWLVVALVTALAFLPWFVFAAGNQLASIGRDGGVIFGRSGTGFALGLGAALYTFSLGETVFPWDAVVLLGVIVIGAVLVKALRSRDARFAFQPMLACFTAVALISATTTFVATGTPFLNVPVRALFALPFFLVAVSRGLLAFGRRTRMLLFAGLVVVWGFSLYNNFSGRQYLNPIYLTPSKEAADLVHARVRPGDVVFSDYDSIFGHYFVTAETASIHRYTNQSKEIQQVLQTRPLRVWLVTIGRDQSERFESATSVRMALSADYRVVDSDRLLPIDPTYLRLKNAVLNRASYEFRLTVELYERNATAALVYLSNGMDWVQC